MYTITTTLLTINNNNITTTTNQPKQTQLTNQQLIKQHKTKTNPKLDN